MWVCCGCTQRNTFVAWRSLGRNPIAFVCFLNEAQTQLCYITVDAYAAQCARPIPPWLLCRAQDTPSLDLPYLAISCAQLLPRLADSG